MFLLAFVFFLSSTATFQVANAVAATPTPCGVPNNYCPGGWTYYPPRQECYMATATALHYQQALDQCSQFGGTLVSIHDQAQNDFINNTIVSTVPASRYWIGLKCTGQSCRWNDGTPYDFNNFANGRPDGASGSAACSGACLVTMLNTGKWDDHGDFAPFNAICQRKSYCPEGWTYYPARQQCYKATQPLRYFQALSQCSQLGGSLASIHGEAQNTFINNTVMPTVPSQRYWIGLICLGQRCRWLDGTPYDYNNFANGRPDGATGSAACIGVCYVSIWNFGKWDDHGDYAPFSAICQSQAAATNLPCVPETTTTKLAPTTTTKAPTTTKPGCNNNNYCPSGWIYYPEHQDCYMVTATALHYQQALDQCSQLGGALVSIHDQAQNGFINSTVISTVPASRYWIGLQCVGQNCTWLDGTPYDYSNFYNGAPDGATGGAACSGACYVTFLNVGKWDDHGDFAPFNAICQKKSYCPEGWTYYAARQECYKATTPLHYQQARDQCSQLGGDLVSIHNQAQNDFINNTVMPAVSSPRYWIGLQCVGKSCIWLDGTPYDYGNFANGVPDGAAGPAACNGACYVSIWSGLGKWDDHGDFSPFSAICLKKAITSDPCATTTPAPTTISALTTTLAPCENTNNNCPNGWAYYPARQECYMVTATALHYQQALDQCSQLGGDLASIHDQAQNDFINTTVVSAVPASRYWIGLQCVGQNCTWLDKTPYDFNNFYNGAPDGASGGAACSGACYVTFLNVGKWDDHGDFAPYNAICQRKSYCPDGWAYYPAHQKCYKATTPLHYQQARDQCSQLGGNLASIHDQAQNDFINSTVMPTVSSQRYWIGLQCVGQNCNWLDGTPFDYGNFANGIPDGATGGAACNGACFVSIWNGLGKWDDHGDYAPFSAICQTQANGSGQACI